MALRDDVIMLVNGGMPEVIPTLSECFMDNTVRREILKMKPDLKIGPDFFRTADRRLGCSFTIETLSRTEEEWVYRYETGAVWKEKYSPTFCRELVAFPLVEPQDAFTFQMPEPHWKNGRETEYDAVRAYKDDGYFVQGMTIGVWMATYYYLTSFDNILMWMAVEEEAAEHIFKMCGDYMLKAAEMLLEAGVDAIMIAGDLGSGHALLFSEEMFRRYVFPHLKALADLCHSYGKLFHLHSHGHIQDLMDGIVETGVDILNPVGPSDHNDLALFKERWGDRITFLGGLSTTIAQMTPEQIEAHVAEVMEIGCKGGRFMPRTESGIPVMEPEKAVFFLDTVEKYRRLYGAGG